MNTILRELTLEMLDTYVFQFVYVVHTSRSPSRTQQDSCSGSSRQEQGTSSLRQTCLGML